MKEIPEDIRELEKKISCLQKQEQSRRNQTAKSEYSGAAAIGFRITAELLSAVIVGGAVGFVIDRLIGSRPLFLSLFLLFGGAAGILNVYRLSKEEEKRIKNKE